MKKILALVLAVAMLSTVAFAVEFTWNDRANPGDTLTLGYSSFQTTVNDVKVDPVSDKDMDKWDFNSDNFTVTAKWKKGADLVKSVAFDDVNVKITLKDSTSLIAPVKDKKAPNVILDKITVKAKRSLKKGTEYVMRAGNSYDYAPTDANLYVGYKTSDVVITEAKNLVKGTITKFTENTKTNDQVAEVSYDASNFMMEGKVYVGDKVFFDFDSAYSDAAKAIAKANEDASIENTTIKLDGLSASHKVILNAEKDAKVYKVVDGKLAPSGLTWNEDEYAFVGKIRSTTEYIVSDIELKGVTTTTPDTTNPDTGANDVVGIAAALAVVSLVAAGAVSLKK